jgi:signal transduction histidine kinase/CheY-like chemotaxis protein
MQIFSSARSEKNIRLGAVLAIIIVAVVAFVIWTSISRMVRDAGWVEHTMMVIDNIDSLDGQITRREAAERIYLVNHDPEYLAQYRSLSANVRRTMSDLKSLTADNPRQQDELRAIATLLDESEIASAPDLGGARFSAGTRSLAAVPNDSLRLGFSSRLSAMRNEAHRLLTIRRSAEQTSIRLTYIVLTLLGVLLAGILAATYLVGRRALEARRQALEESAHLNAELEKTNVALEHKRNEADHANKLKSQFLASMSHELRTPLNAINGFSELLVDQVAGPLNEKQLRFLSHIREGSKHLLQLINDILDLSKIEAGESRLELASIGPSAVVEEVVTGLGSLAREKSIQVKVVCDPDAVLRVDRRRLKQILYNLVSNAIKFTPENGHVSVKVAPDRDSLRFEVTDNGPGIAAEDQKIIFEEFRQAATSTSGVKEGTGLGLAITKKLVEQHGGHIEVESEPGSGSTFRFWLPWGAQQQPVSEQPIAGTLRYVRRSGEEAPVILVVDDELNARELIRNVLENAGYRVVTADSGASALRSAREAKPDLITLDLLMPGGNGFGTLYELRLLFRDDPPPVVIVSIVDDRATGFALGAADYLIKPVGKTDLLDAIRKHLPPADAGLLVVDDDPAMLELAQEVFSDPWIRLYVAASGREGLTVLESKAIDAILLDLIMPEMDGFEFLQALQADPRLAQIPVSVLTSKDLSEPDIEKLRHKVDSVFSKNAEWKPGLIRQIARSLGRAQGKSGLS